MRVVKKCFNKTIFTASAAFKRRLSFKTILDVLNVKMYTFYSNRGSVIFACLHLFDCYKMKIVSFDDSSYKFKNEKEYEEKVHAWMHFRHNTH